MMKLDLQLFASGTIAGGNYNSIYGYYLNWSSTPNIAGNYSDVTVQWIYKKNASDPYNAFNTSGTSKVNITIDNTSSGNLNAPFDLRSASVGSAVVIASFSKRVYHADNGQKSVNISATHTTGNSWGTKTIASTSRTLDTIARATTCPNLSGYIEDTYTIALNPASTNFTHSLKVTFGSITGFINASGNLQSAEYKFSNKSINFTIPSSFYQQFSSKKGEGTFTLNTYDGASLIGSKTSTLTANCLESRCRPTISGSVVDVNSITKALTGNSNKLIKGFSNVKITPTIKASSTNGDTKSTVSSKAVDGITFTTDTVTLNKVSKKDFTITVTNNRGFSTSKIVSASSIIDYFAPSMDVAFARTTQTSAQVKLTYKGSFFNASFGSVANQITVKWYWKERTASTWTLGGTLIPSLNGDTIKQSTVDCGSIFDYQVNYRFKLEVIDKLSNGNKEMDVTAGIPNFSFGKGWFEHHTDAYFDKKAIFQAGLELFHTTPYLDFHFANASDDFTSRLIEKKSGLLTCENGFDVIGKLTEKGKNVLCIEAAGHASGGFWIKFSDGTMIITQRERFNSIKVNFQWGNVYTNFNDKRQLSNFAQSFKEIPVILLNVQPVDYSSGDCWIITNQAGGLTSIDNPGGFQIARGTESANISIIVNVLAFGKWK